MDLLPGRGVFVWGFTPHSRFFLSFGNVTIASEGLQILTYALHLWHLSSEGSLVCHTYCDSGHPFIMVFSEDPSHSHLMPSVWQWTCHYLFLRVATGIWTPNLPLAGRKLSPTAPPPRLRGCKHLSCIYLGLKIHISFGGGGPLFFEKNILKFGKPW